MTAMDDTRAVLRAHFARYPRMMPCDAVKLLFQNAFGGGHLLTDPDACARQLAAEYASVAQKADAPLYEDIGNGHARLQLNALDAAGLSADDAAALFYRSAQERYADRARFDEKLALLEQMTRDGEAPFDADALAAYLTAYREAGCPAVSHSDAYRTAYAPAYRVVQKALCKV